MNDVKDILEREWAESRRNISNQVLVEMTHGSEEKLGFMLNRLSSTVLIRSRRSGSGGMMSKLLALVMELEMEKQKK